MKKLQRLCATTVFALLLTTTLSAGEISTPGIAQPAPTPIPASSSAMAAGEVPIGVSTPEIDASESTLLTDTTLYLLQIMLTVF